MFTQRANALTGRVEWASAAAGAAEAAAAVAASSHLDMLNDAPRNEAYARALGRCAVEAKAGPPLRALDIGAGTGLLSMLAARAMQAARSSGGRVDACELHPPMAELAERCLRGNGLLDDPVFLHKARSDELKAGVELAEGRASLLVSEIFDSSLLGEGVIPSLRDARRRLLAEGAAVVPAVATVWAVPVSCPALRRHGAGAERSEVVALHWAAAAARLPGGGGGALCTPKPMLRFDFRRRDVADRGAACEGAGAEQVEARMAAHADFHVDRDGQLDAVLAWFELDFVGDGAITYSMRPPEEVSQQPHYCDHWKQELFLLGSTAAGEVAGRCLRAGETLHLLAAHDECALHFALASSSEAAAGPPSAAEVVERAGGGAARLSLDALHERLRAAEGHPPRPHFADACGALPWRHALRWFYEASRARRNGEAPDEAWQDVRRARIVAAPIRAPELARSRGRLVPPGVPGVDGGIDLSDANDLLGAPLDEEGAAAPLPAALWQLPTCEPAGPAATVLELDAEAEAARDEAEAAGSPDAPPLVGTCEVACDGSNDRAADCVALWVEYGHLDGSGEMPFWRAFERQAVCVLPWGASEHGRWRVRAELSRGDGSIEWRIDEPETRA